MNKKVRSTKAYKYAKGVIDGKILACRNIIAAAERFLNDLERKDLIFDLEAVEFYTQFFEKQLYVPELKKPVPLPLPHAFWIQQIYGFKVKKTGLRRFQSVYIQVARKNYKTFYAASLSLVEALVGPDSNPTIMQGANSRDQAIICTDMTGKIIRASPGLRKMVDSEIIALHTYRKKVNEIVVETPNLFARVEAMPKDPGDGGNPSVGIVDEFHEAKDSSLLETIESGQGQREQPLTVVITSPGHNKQGPCYSNLRKKSIDVVNGTVKDDSHLALVFELDEEEEWDKIRMLVKSNPMIPYSKTLKPYLARRIKKAKIEGGEIAANIKIKNCGLWIDAPKIWIPIEIYKRNNYNIPEKEYYGKNAYGGLDLSAGMDLNAFVNFIPNVREENRKIKVVDNSGKLKTVIRKLPIHVVRSLFWIPESKIENQKDDAVDYRKWVEQEHIRAFFGNAVEYEFIAEDMKEEMDKQNMIVLAADPKYLHTGPTGWLRNDGYLEPSGDFLGLFPVAQGFGLTAAVGEIEMWLNNGQIDFQGNPVMKMCFQNTTLHTKDMVAEEGGLSGHRYPSKGRSNGRIDGVSALCTAVHKYLEIQAEPGEEENSIEIW